jgi:hypothetical protein
MKFIRILLLPAAPFAAFNLTTSDARPDRQNGDINDRA